MVVWTRYLASAGVRGLKGAPLRVDSSFIEVNIICTPLRKYGIAPGYTVDTRVSMRVTARDIVEEEVGGRFKLGKPDAEKNRPRH